MSLLKLTAAHGNPIRVSPGNIIFCESYSSDETDEINVKTVVYFVGGDNVLVCESLEEIDALTD